VGLSLNAFIFSLICLPGFRSVLANDASRAALVGLLALAPHAENLGLLTGQHWYLGYALALLLLMQMPSGLGGRVGVVLGASFCAWSSPSALVLLPFWAWNGFRSGDHFTKRLSAVVVVQLVLYALAMLVFRGTEGSRSAAFEVGDMAAAAGNLLGRGWLVSGLVGRGVAESVVSVAPLLADGLAVGLLLGIGFGVWRMSLNAWGAPVMFLGIGALMAVFSLTRTLYLSELAQLELPRHVRYLTAPTLLLIVGVWLMLGPWLASRWVKVVFVFQVLAFFWGGLVHENHWARSPELFRFREHVESIESFERDFVEAGFVGSLYLPHEIPYWGPVLESAGGALYSPEAGILDGLNAESDADGVAQIWLGSFQVLDAPDRMDHALWGQLTYTGTELGRIWFVDGAGRQLFTSELLYPYAWVVDGLDMTLVSPTD